MGLDLIGEFQRSLALVQEDVEDGILYLDGGAAEACHLNGGLPSLLELGARAICSLEQASPFDAAVSWRGTQQDPVEKLVILNSRLLTDSHQNVLRCLRMHQSIKQCTIWTSISEEAHSAHLGTSFGLDAFHDYKNSLLRELAQPDNDVVVSNWQSVPQGEAPDIRVKHFPLMVCSFTKTMFVLPSGGSVAEAPLSDRHDVHAISERIPGVEVTLQSGGEENIPAGATLLAHCLQSIGTQLDLKFEVFSLGPLARKVGNLMSGLSIPPEGGHPRQSAGLVLIDRSQDLITPSCHGDSLLDRIFSSLPRRTTARESSTGQSSQSVWSSTTVRPSVDLQIPINPGEESRSSSTPGPCFPFFPTTISAVGTGEDMNADATPINLRGNVEVGKGPINLGVSLSTREDLLGGSISTSWNRRGSEYLESLLGKRTKDSMWLIRKWLQEAHGQEKINIPGKGRLGAVSVNELILLRKKLSSNPELSVRHIALIQLARAAEIALGPPWAAHWDACAGAEKILMLSAGDSSQSLALQLQDIVQQCIQNLHRSSYEDSMSRADYLSLRDALTLAIVGYGLAGEGMISGSLEGPFDWQEEQSLKESVVEAILQGSSGSNLGFLNHLQGGLATLHLGADRKEKSSSRSGPDSQNNDKEWFQWDGGDPVGGSEEESEEYGNVQLKLELRDRLGEVFGTLHKVATACLKSPLKELSLPLENQINSGVLHAGLIYKLVSHIFAKLPIPGLIHHASGMGRFFKGGFGRFGIRQATPKLSDQKVILVFVIGGLNFVEVREAREAQTAFPTGESVELLLGGTSLITPEDMYDLSLGSCGSA